MKYKQIMDRIEVTPEMRQRILENIEVGQAKKPKKLTRQILSLAACAAIVLCCWFAWKPRQPQDTQDTQQGMMANAQIENVSTLEALAEKTGVPMKELTGLPFAVEQQEYLSYWNELAEIRYIGETENLRYRKSLGTQDNSGDYNEYSQETTVPLSGCTVTLKGGTDGYVLAIWTDGTYAYSVSISVPMSEDVFQTWLKENFETP